MINWTSSGIRNTFQYEMIDLDFTTSLGYIQGVITGTLTLGYNTDFKRVATIKAVDSNINPTYLIRIWHIASLGTETYKHCLGTFFIANASAEVNNGLYTGTFSLKSPLAALQANEFTTSSVKQGSSIMNNFKSRLKDSGCVIGDCAEYNHSTATFNKDRIIDFGTTYLTECHNIANALGGRLDVDDFGGVIIEPYIPPAQKAVTSVIPTGMESIILPTLGIGPRDITNKVIVKYEKDKVSYYGIATLPRSHPWHFDIIGHYHTASYSLTELAVPDNATAAQIKTALGKYAEDRLQELSDVYNTYSFDILYMPMKCGERVKTSYSEGNFSQDIEGILTDMQIELNGLMRTSIVIKEV